MVAARSLLTIALAQSALRRIALAQSAPVLTYFAIAGRGELARLYAVVGGLDIVDSLDTQGYKQKTPIGYLPALAHPEGGLFPACEFAFGCLQESLAVERYLRELAPGFANLTAPQRAVDDMVAMIKEDVLALVEPGAANASLAPAAVPPAFDRYLGVLERGYVPDDGFVNGLAHPTGADLAVLVMLRSGFPFGEAIANAGYDGASEYPKTYALADRAAAFPAVAEYLATSQTFYAV